MKIKVNEKSYDEVISKKEEKHKRPCKPNMFFRTIMDM